MTKNRFLLQASDYDSKYEFRVADLTRVEKTIEDFWNEKAGVYDYFEYLYYLSRNKAFLTMEEANKIFNGLHEENEELQHKLSQQEMEYATDLHRLAEENEQLKKDCTVLIYHNQEYRKENEQLKEEIKGLNDILARYEEKELKEQTDHEEKDCGHCKHLQIDGMFGMWCEKKRNWTDVRYCEDFERDVHDSYLF